MNSNHERNEGSYHVKNMVYIESRIHEQRRIENLVPKITARVEFR